MTNGDLLTSKQLMARFQFSAMTLWRLERNEEANFPKAVYIGRSKRWRKSEIEVWEADLVCR